MRRKRIQQQTCQLIEVTCCWVSDGFFFSLTIANKNETLDLIEKWWISGWISYPVVYLLVLWINIYTWRIWRMGFFFMFCDNGGNVFLLLSSCGLYNHLSDRNRVQSWQTGKDNGISWTINNYTTTIITVVTIKWLIGENEILIIFVFHLLIRLPQ